MDTIKRILENEWANLGFNIILTSLIAFLLLKLEKKFAVKWIKKHDDINSKYVHQILRFMIIFIAALWVLMTSSLTKSFGGSLFQGTAVIAAIAGFAAKPILSDMFCGIMISTTKPFNIGDRIELNDGTVGIVKDITIRHVVLQGIDTLKIIIPNSLINEKMLTNLSHQTKTRSIHFRFTVGLKSNISQVKKVILDAVCASAYSIPRNGEEYSPVYFIAYQDNGLLMSTTVYYEPGTPTEIVKDDINSRVKAALDASNIEIPYPYITVTAPPVEQRHE